MVCLFVGPGQRRASRPLPSKCCLQVLGTEELFQYLDHYDLELDPQFDGLIGRHAAKPWAKFITPENSHLCSDDAVNFVGSLLKYDHQERPTAIEAMAHPYFAPIRQSAAAAEEVAKVVDDDAGASSEGGKGP